MLPNGSFLVLAFASALCAQPGLQWADGFDAAVLGNANTAAVYDDGQGPSLFFGAATLGTLGGPNALLRFDGRRVAPLGPGMHGVVSALLAGNDGQGPALFVGGLFIVAGGANVRHVVRYDGATIQPLGAAFNGDVLALAFHDDGSGPALHAAGGFTMAGGVPADRVAKWNGSAWSPVGNGFPGGVFPAEIRALRSYDDGGGAALYAAGRFTSAGSVPAKGIAKLIGAQWAEVGGGLSSATLPFPEVGVLRVFDDGSGARLYAAGKFNRAGTLAVSNIAAWDGSAWSAMQGGTDDVVKSLEVFTDSQGTALFACGWFRNAGGLATGGIARWSGSAWSAIGPQVRIGTAMAVFDAGSGPALYVAGSATTAGLGAAAIVNGDALMKYDGSSWSNPGGHGMVGSPRALVGHTAGGTTRLVAGGGIGGADAHAFANVAQFDGSAWTAMGPGLGFQPLALASHDAGGGARVYAGGALENNVGPPATFACPVRAFDGSAWQLVGSPFNSAIYELAVADLGSGSALYAGGAFAMSGASSVSRIAQLGPAGWSPLGAGISGTGAEVRAIAAYDAGSGPRLYAAGRFSAAGGAPASNIASWDGSAWAPVAGGVDGDVHALAVIDDGGGPRLIAAGAFLNAGGAPAERIAAFDGSAWAPLGAGLSGANAVVTSLLAFDDGSGPVLVAAGTFAASGATALSNVACWKNGAWSAVDGGIDGGVEALATADLGGGPSLFAAGQLTRSGAFAVRGIAEARGTSPLLAFSQGRGVGAGVTVLDSRLEAGAETFNVFSGETSGAAGGGPYLGLYASDPAFLVLQISAPLGAVPFHFLAGASTASFGPYALPPGLVVDGLCITVSPANGVRVSPLRRVTVQ